jgi:hypothetical protein
MGKEHTFLEIDSDDSGLYFCMAQNAVWSQNFTEHEVKVKGTATLLHFLYVTLLWCLPCVNQQNNGRQGYEVTVYDVACLLWNILE